MRGVSTTVVAIVGSEPGDGVDVLASSANVAAARPDPHAAPLERAVAAWQDARRTHLPYLVHDADPLVLVADAWVRRFDETGATGELEIAVAETLTRWRAGSLELPDYYIVVDPDGLEPTHRHWYLGFLFAHASRRVIPVNDVEQAAPQLRRLRAGPWWPDLDVLLDGVDRVVPDLVGTPADSPI